MVFAIIDLFYQIVYFKKKLNVMVFDIDHNIDVNKLRSLLL